MELIENKIEINFKKEKDISTLKEEYINGSFDCEFQMIDKLLKVVYDHKKICNGICERNNTTNPNGKILKFYYKCSECKQSFSITNISTDIMYSFPSSKFEYTSNEIIEILMIYINSLSYTKYFNLNSFPIGKERVDSFQRIFINYLKNKTEQILFNNRVDCLKFNENNEPEKFPLSSDCSYNVVTNAEWCVIDVFKDNKLFYIKVISKNGK